MNESESRTQIESLLRGLRRRQRGLNALRWMLHGMLIGGAAGCLAALLTWALGATDFGWMVVAASSAVAGFAAIGCLAGAMLPVRDLALARALDHAGKGHDRFASALQLIGDRHQDRVRLVVEDALSHVRGTPAAAALPVRMPRAARWIPAALGLVVVTLLILPQPVLQAAPNVAPEISAEEWKQIADEFNRDLAQLPKPLTPEEEELQKELEKLAEKLNENPDKKEALKDIARLSDRVEKERRSISAKELSLRKAAKAMSKSAALQQFAAKMQQGDYQNASDELKTVSQKMQEGELSPDAEEFESLAQDLEQLAKELEGENELEQECQNASSAASKMNKKELAEALKRMAEQMKKNAGKYQRSDNLAKRKSMLDELKRRMNQGKCQGCEEGCSECEGEGFCDRPGTGKKARKGGLKAGWGSMADWNGGSLTKQDENRTGELSDAQEGPGATTTFQMVSPEEKARSGKRYEELFAEFVQKSEADLDLDSVPVAQRDFLRRYFRSIRPQEPAESRPEGSQPPVPTP